MRTRTTAAQFKTFLALPEHANRRFELVYGEISEKRPTQLRGYIIHMLSGFLFVFLRQNPLGFTLIEARYRLPGDDENDLISDLSFVVQQRGALARIGAAPYMPDLAVEVQSEGQSERFMLDKALLYLEQGTRMVWIIYPTRQIVEVLTAAERHLLTIDDTLSGSDVLPGFSVSVRDLFPMEEGGDFSPNTLGQV